MTNELLLETYLKQLRLPCFLESYQALAQEAARTNLSYERYLFALAQEEVIRQDASRIERAIANAHFPVLKELADFDFSVLPDVPKPRILDLAQGGYISRAEPIILIGNPGLRENACGERIGRCGVSPGAQSSFLQCRRLSQRVGPGPTRVSALTSHDPDYQARSGYFG